MYKNDCLLILTCYSFLCGYRSLIRSSQGQITFIFKERCSYAGGLHLNQMRSCFISDQKDRDESLKKAESAFKKSLELCSGARSSMSEKDFNEMKARSLLNMGRDIYFVLLDSFVSVRVTVLKEMFHNDVYLKKKFDRALLSAAFVIWPIGNFTDNALFLRNFFFYRTGVWQSRQYNAMCWVYACCDSDFQVIQSDLLIPGCVA